MFNLFIFYHFNSGTMQLKVSTDTNNLAFLAVRPFVQLKGRTNGHQNLEAPERTNGRTDGYQNLRAPERTDERTKIDGRTNIENFQL